MEKYLLGLDNGGTMSKAALYDLEGHEIAVSSRKTELIQPQPGFTERDSNEMWAANVGAIRAVIAQAGIGKNVDISTMEILDHDTTVLQADRKVLCEMLDPTPYWRRK